MTEGERAAALQTHHDAIRREFDRQAPSWAAAEAGEPLRWVVSHLALERDLDVLDVAAGTGLFGSAIAPHVRSVTAIDVSSKMLELGEKRAAAFGIRNIVFAAGSAEALPFENESYDLVVTRYSIHHFVEPIAALQEMARVARFGAAVAVVDMLAHDDPAIALRQNDLEKTVDSTHTHMLPARELAQTFVEAGLHVESQLCRDVAVDFERWQSHLDPDDTRKETVRAALIDEIAGGPVTGFRPFLDGNRLHFYHTLGVVLARKERVS